MISCIHKCFFICIPKTGSTSVQSALKRFGFKENGQYKKHFTNKEYKEFKRTRNYFSFTFVRNPFDRLVSEYHFTGRPWYSKIYKIKYDLTFHNYVKYVVGEGKPFSRHRFESKSNTVPPGRQWAAHMISAGDKDWSMFQFIADGVDFIGRFENFQEDFNTVCNKIGIPQQKLAHVNATKHKHYTEYYNDETRQIVAEKYAKDIEYFGYEFGG